MRNRTLRLRRLCGAAVKWNTGITCDASGGCWEEEQGCRWFPMGTRCPFVHRGCGSGQPQPARPETPIRPRNGVFTAQAALWRALNDVLKELSPRAVVLFAACTKSAYVVV